MNRRRLLFGATASLPFTRAAFARPSTPAATGRRLIVVFLRGAVDGLNVLVPYGEANYHRLRPRIAIARPGNSDGAFDLDGRFGLHPALAPLLPFWQQGSLAFVHAAGSPDPTRSHFDGQDNIETGTPGNKATSDGWLNRLMGVLSEGTDLGSTVLQAISVGPLLPRIFAGGNRITLVGSGAAALQPGALDRPKISQAFAGIYQGNTKEAQAFRDYVDAHGELAKALEAADPEMQAANNSAPPSFAFAGDAARLGTLMRQDRRVRLGFLAVGGWDTHANQGGAKGQLAGLLAPLAQGLVGLAEALGPAYDDTAIIVVSEFGRTVAQNGNGGTDHGHGNVLWLMGRGLIGGRVHGQWPGLDDSQLYEGRDLMVTTDYRTVLAEVCERHLLLSDAKLATVFPRMSSGAPIGVVRARS